MFHFEVNVYKQLCSVKYTFPNIGDGIAMHDHTDDQKHNVIVLKGQIAIYGPDKCWIHFIKAGDMMDLLDEHHPHEIYAVEPDSVVLSFNAEGPPEGAHDLPEDERSGTVTKKMPTLSPF